jgi:DNA-directed RNA polymerase specialized sigma subunit
VIRIPHSSLKKREDDFDGHAGIPVFLVGQGREDDGSGEELLSTGVEVQQSTAEPEALVKELMCKICKNDMERRVLDLRMEGRSQKEIAFLVKLSYQRIAQILLAIKEAYIYQKEGVV